MKTIFIRAIDAENKDDTLLLAIQNLNDAQHLRFEIDPFHFSGIPGSPFAYWINKSLRIAFQNYPPFEVEGRTAKQGLATADDFRFIRTSWEIHPNHVRGTWFPLAKGGDFSPFYADMHLVINWKNEGKEIFNFVNDAGKLKSRPQNTSYFFRPALTWSLRTSRGLSTRAMPVGCVFGHKGPAAFVEGDNPTVLSALLSIMNSRAFTSLIELQLAAADAAARSYEVGVIQGTPVPDFSKIDEISLAILSQQAWSLKYALDTRSENSHVFYLPALLQVHGERLSDRAKAWIRHVNTLEMELKSLQAEIDDRCFALYKIDSDTHHYTGQGSSDIPSNKDTGNTEDGEDNEAIESDVTTMASGLISWLVGVAWARWDVRFSTGEKKTPQVPELFASLPVCPPGMLQNVEGLPTIPTDIPADYPLRISWSGILVDDSGHLEDIEGRVREVLRVIWPDCADAIEQEACEILGVGSLRAYFANPSRFFDDHLKRYSKSRRAAPIYWPLSTPSGSYTLWLYYHRLTDQTLYSCVNDFVEPKLAQVSSQAAELQRRSNRSRQEEKELEQVSDLALELGAFRDELLRIARFWQPNLNDGVQITAAPLWRLFQHRPWQKRLKETWSALEAGDYDWAHLAYSIWPDRVRAKCKTDKSLAIAHDLEHLYVEPVKPVKAKKGAKSKPQAEAEQGELL